MKFIYPAIFHKTENGYRASFPDLEGIDILAETLEEAVDEANQAASEWLSAELQEEEPFLPPVSDPEDLDLLNGDVVRNICVTIRFYEGWDE